ncbi:hypothetical protein [Sphingobacterium endophyticum]|uniref:hypothetical protein n=1 Tax=Sphingobacterium endophyticum TaxID=2546448 RepID=UPI0012E2B309|nr:hypothetical protein [Sphingobacterium endophyticum]
MVKISLLFLVAGILVIAFAFFVPAKDSAITLSYSFTYYVVSSISLFKFLGLLGLIFAGLYHFTDQYLYSKTWSVMHLICFLCLIINIWTYGFVERVYFGNLEDSLSKNIPDPKEMERFERIEKFYTGTFIIMILLQFLYVINLIVGLIYRKSNSEN